jgi:hypothetical protein
MRDKRKREILGAPDTASTLGSPMSGLDGVLLVPAPQLNYSHLKWEFVWEPLEAVRVTSYLSNRSSKRLSSFS